MASHGEEKVRGRGRGRDRGHDRDRDRSEPDSRRGRGDPRSAPRPQGAWGRRPGPSHEQQEQFSEAAYTAPSLSKQSTERATSRFQSRDEGAPVYQAGHGDKRIDVGAAGDQPSGHALGRGALRGRRAVVPELFTRPTNLVTKKGTTGTPVTLQANYFKLLATTDWCLYQYRVDFAPEEDRTFVRKGLLRTHKATLGAYVFDGTVLYTSHRLPDHQELWSIRQSDETKIRISIRLVGDIMKGDQHYLQFFNIIMRKCLELLKLQLVGREYFDARSKVEVREFKLELWPGYITSIRQLENDILMCCEITHKVMRQQTLLDILNECYQQDSRNYKKLYDSQVIGLTVLTGYNNNTYRISDIDYDTTPKSTFQLRNGEQISYKDYYQNKYQIRIRNESQPMLVTKVKPKERRAGQPEFVYLVPELCCATGLTDKMRSNFNLMAALATYTRVAPKSRLEKLMTFNRRLRQEQEIVQELKDWNLKLDDRLVDIPGRVLQPERIVFGSNQMLSAGQFANWTREMQKKPAFNPTQLTNWVLICMNRMRRDVERFVATLQQCAHGINCRIDTPRYWNINDDRSNTYTEAIEQIMSTSNPMLLFCVVSNNRADRYGAIKKKCTIDRPVPCQVFLAKNLNSRGVLSIATKVAIQLNCKLGGAPWSIELPPINLMVVGFDVCHDPSDRTRDFGAMVASLNKSLTRYFSAISAHTTGEELSNEFSVQLVKALHNYRQMNKCLPSHIVIYRDGVGEGQISQVYEHEVEQIKSKLNGIYGENVPVKMAFIIVTKRINTRFFLNQDNPMPGTIVDDVVTDPFRYDFYIVSQSVRQGTVTPCAYNVIADTTGWKADQMQRLTYKLTHMYYNWSGTVRVPAPCQYAHKLAFLVAQFVRRPPSTHMENLLYYL